MKWSYFILIGITCLSLWMIYRARRRRDYPTIPLANAIKHMKTGDLVLFSGRNIGDPADTEQMIKRVAHLSATYIYRAVDACEFGHVAVVYKDQTTNEVYLVHCELSAPESDLFAGEPVTGVQVTPLIERVKRYRGYCVWRPINKPIENDKLLDFVKKTYHMGYFIPADVIVRCVDRLTRAYRRRYPLDISGPFANKRNSFCTEYIGALYEECGIFDKHKGPYKTFYMPSDFTLKKVDRYLTNDYSFRNEGWELINE